MMKERNLELSVLQSHSLREMVEMVNDTNQAATMSGACKPILKEDIVTLLKENGTYFLVYFK